MNRWTLILVLILLPTILLLVFLLIEQVFFIEEDLSQDDKEVVLVPLLSLSFCCALILLQLRPCPDGQYINDEEDVEDAEYDNEEFDNKLWPEDEDDNRRLEWSSDDIGISSCVLLSSLSMTLAFL